MGFLDRIGSLIKANVNDLISKAEDPEKMINQMILDMNEQFKNAKSEVAGAIAHEKQLKAKVEDHEKQMNHWSSKAEIAIKHDSDDLALEALKRKKEHETLAEKYRLEYDKHHASTAELKEGLRQLADKIEDARREKDVLIARSKTVKAQEKIQETASVLNSTSSFETMDRMEKKIIDMEARVSANNELNEMLNGNSFEEKINNLEKNSDLNLELEMMKQKLKSEDA